MAPNGDVTVEVTKQDLLDTLGLIGYLLDGLTKVVETMVPAKIAFPVKGDDPHPVYTSACWPEVFDAWKDANRPPFTDLNMA